MAVRSSPRLRAILYSNPSGKPAVFAPRLNRVTTSERALRSRNTTKSKPISDTETTSPSKLSRGKKPVVNKAHSNRSKGVGGASENVSAGKRRPTELSQKRQRTLTSPTKGSKRLKKGGVVRREERKSAEVATKCKQRKTKVLASSVNDNNPPHLEHGIDCVNRTNSAPTSVTVKRKRGRPPKNVASCKRVKLAAGNTSEVNMDGALLKSKVFIDLTCDDEIIGDEDTEATITTPFPSTSPDLTQRSNANSLTLTCSPEASRQNFEESIDGDSNEHTTSMNIEIDYHRMSLDSEETIAQLFDLGVKEDETCVQNTNSEMATVPSLKRSTNINPFVAKVEASSEQASQFESASSEATDSSYSPTEEEYPQPSTAQQKLIRRLARQKQLEEMKAREAALSREERLLRRKGVLPSTKATAQDSAKRISWRDDTDLVEMFIYSPVRDDDEDTVSIHSDDALSMEITLS